jgi:hypothetical protein
MTAMRQKILACLMLVLLSVLGRPAMAQDAPVSELDLKAAFLFNFTKFVEWPAEAFQGEDATVNVGVFDSDEDFTKTLKTLLSDKKAHGRSFSVRKLTNPAEAKTCHILFFRERETKKMTAAYESVKRLPILTVGESDEFLDQGGMFNLFFEDKQLRFEVNQTTAENAKLTVSSKLLRLAKKTRKGGAK